MSDYPTKTDYQPIPEVLIEDLDTLKVLADPLRLRIRELLIQPRTVKEIAKVLDIPATKLYYHINLLEKHKLIVVVDTRIVSGIIEKHYQVASQTVRVASHLLSPQTNEATQSFDLTINSLFDDARNDLRESFTKGIIQIDDEAPPHQTMSVGSARFYLTNEQANDLYDRMQVIYEEFHALSEAQLKNSDTTMYKFLHALFPSSRQYLREDENED